MLPAADGSGAIEFPEFYKMMQIQKLNNGYQNEKDLIEVRKNTRRR